MKHVIVTDHAVLRWQERVDCLATQQQARRAIERCARGATRLPSRIGRELGGGRNRATCLAGGGALLILVHRRVVTVLALDWEAIAALLVWRVTGIWTGCTPHVQVPKACRLAASTHELLELAS